MPPEPRSNHIANGSQDRHTALFIPSTSGHTAATAKLITMHRLACRLASKPTTTPSDLWYILKSLDTPKTVRDRLDRSTVESLPRAKWTPFLGAYIAACVTALARESDMLGPIERSGMVRLAVKGRLKGYVPPLQEPDKPWRVRSGGVPSALVPVEHDIPHFSADFLTIVEEQLWNTLESRKLLAEGKSGEADLNKMLVSFRNSAGNGLLLDATRSAIEQYIDRADGKEGTPLVDIVASREATYLFPWLVSLGLLDDMVKDLLRNGKTDSSRANHGIQ